MNMTIKLSGPLFDDFGKQAVNAIKKQSMILNAEIAQSGKKRLQDMLQSKPSGVLLSVDEAGKNRASGARGTSYRNTLHIAASALNVIIMDRNAIYGPWLEGTSSRNSSTRFKGYFSFRKVSEWLEREEIPKIARKYESIFADMLNVGGV